MIGERFQSSALPADWQPNYDRQPAVAVPDSDGAASAGWDDIAERLTVALDHVGPKAGGPTLCIDCYDGVDVDAIIAALTERLTPNRIVDTRTLFKSPDELNAMLEPWLGGDDPIFGFLNPVTLDAFFDTAKIDAAQRELASASASADPGSSASSA